jgi:hypothetical protein
LLTLRCPAMFAVPGVSVVIDGFGWPVGDNTTRALPLYY